MNCPRCGGFMNVQAVTVIRKRGCLTTLFYIFLLFLPVVGWIALFLLLRGKRSKEKSVAVCQQCGLRRNV